MQHEQSETHIYRSVRFGRSARTPLYRSVRLSRPTWTHLYRSVRLGRTARTHRYRSVRGWMDFGRDRLDGRNGHRQSFTPTGDTFEDRTGEQHADSPGAYRPTIARCRPDNRRYHAGCSRNLTPMGKPIDAGVSMAWNREKAPVQKRHSFVPYASRPSRPVENPGFNVSCG